MMTAAGTTISFSCYDAPTSTPKLIGAEAMGLLDLFSSKTKSRDGLRQAPCILCGKMLDVGRNPAASTFFYPLTGKRYALCPQGCDRKGRPDNNKIWSRIAAIAESQRAKSDVSDIR
jgi:hypothetical protein